MRTIPRSQARPRRRAPDPALLADAAMFAALAALTITLGNKVIGAPFHGNPKIAFAAPAARPDAVIAWAAAAVQLAVVAFHRRLPVITWLVAAAMAVVHVVVIGWLEALAAGPSGFAPLVPADAVVLVALHSAVTVRGPAVRIALGLGSLGVAGYASARAVTSPWWLALILLSGGVLLAWLAGTSTRNRNAYLAALRQRAADLEQARVREGELAAAAERARIAREVHDSVAHALNIIVIQAQGALAKLRKRPEDAGQALEAVVATGRHSLQEMRHLLTVITDDSEPGRSPVPGLAELPGLVDQLRQAGRAAELAVEGNLDGLPATVGQSVYRVVQESLTNTVKHASPTARVHVRVRRDYDAVDVRVEDSGTPAPAQAGDGTGHGISGMRERVALLGGVLDAAPRPDGNFVVHARIPVPDGQP